MFKFIKRKKDFKKEISYLKERVQYLENENIELTNCLYEIENKIDFLLDKIEPKQYDFSEFPLDE